MDRLDVYKRQYIYTYMRMVKTIRIQNNQHQHPLRSQLRKAVYPSLAFLYNSNYVAQFCTVYLSNDGVTPPVLRSVFCLSTNTHTQTVTTTTTTQIVQVRTT